MSEYYVFSNSEINRSILYYKFLNSRKTYINLLIIFSVINFKNDFKLSFLSYCLIFLYSFLSLSRIDLFLLIFLHLIINVNFKKFSYKNFFLIITLFFIVFFYRFLLTKQTFLLFLIEPTHLTISSMIFFKNISAMTFYEFLKLNLFFFFNDFFYINVNYFNYFYADSIPSFSIRAIDSILGFFFVFLIYSLFLRFLIKNFYLSKKFILSLYCFLFISLFRGNFVHNLNFVIKLYFLIICLQWLIKTLRQLKLKVV